MNPMSSKDPMNDVTDVSVAERVEAGIQKLDSVVPGWDALIDRPIDVASPLGCPCGQVFGSFSAALAYLQLKPSSNSWYFGFLREDRADEVALNAEWERRIALRIEDQKRAVDELLEDLAED